MVRRYRGWAAVGMLAALSMGAASGVSRVPLVEAVKAGDAVAVHSLIQQRVDVNAPAVDGATALHYAVYRQDLAMVDQLIRAGANTRVANRFGITPTFLAAEAGNPAVLERLLKGGGDANAAAPGGETALMTAARTGNLSAVKILLSHGALPNAREATRDQTALMWAATEGHTPVVKALLEAGADLKARSSELKVFHESTFLAGRAGSDSRERLPMFTPFMFSVLGGHLDTARTLLKAGADVNDITPTGTPALHVAIVNAHWELAIVLLEMGADPNVESLGGTALHHVARVRSGKVMVRQGGLPPPEPTGSKTSIELVKALVAAGANVNARITKPMVLGYGPNLVPLLSRQVGLTPLLMTTIPADPTYMRALLAAGADPHLSTTNGTTLLVAAAGIGVNCLLGDDEEALANVKTVVELGLDINAKNEDGDTALHGAAFRNSVPMMEYLIAHGAKIDTKNTIGWTPLLEAHWTSHLGLLNTRPEAAAFLRKLYAERGLPTVVPGREEAIEKLLNSRGGPIISCPEGLTVKSAGGQSTIVNYKDATATTRRRYAKLETTCAPASGSAFPDGTTTVTCTAVDDNNRSDSCTVLMKVLP